MMSDSTEHDLDDERVPAGDFSPWLAEMEGALRGERGSNVPCGTCTACCTASQFIHIGPDESDALAHIPAELLFPAPRLPRGHVLLGYDERGHCPMLVDDACSIYEHRPRTCRTYDCRVFPAAGLEPDADKPHIAQRTRRWQFSHPTDGDCVEHDAVRAAASFIAGHPDSLPIGKPRPTATQLAVLAIEAHRVFVGRDEQSVDPQEVRVELTRRRQ
jgi:uncharacterized protein